jgi:2-haloacid dehalogenase
MNRREFLLSTTAGVAAGLLSNVAAAEPRKVIRYKAVVFDAFPIFDPRPVFALASGLVPQKSSEFINLWKNRQFEYTWLRTLSGQYVDFPTVTREALVFAAKSLKIELSSESRDRLVDSYFRLKAWPDVQPALERLRKFGLRIGFLSNFSSGMLEANIKEAGLDGYFEKILSTDRVKAFKPDPRAYRMGVEAFGLSSSEIVFAAFAGWDAAGAKIFGYPTYWVNRQDSVEEELGVHVDAAGGIAGLVDFVTA